MTELERITERYLRRKQSCSTLYDLSNPSVYMSTQEKERVLAHWIKTIYNYQISNIRLLEVGCGEGANLLEFIRFGFKPENLVGNELLEERVAKAINNLPIATEILAGDACELKLADSSFEVVYQSTVFSSILDSYFQQKLADRMWSLVKPGGGVLWYDFIVNNPKNSDVKGVPVSRVKSLFPYGEITVWRITLAPPISRLVTKIHPSLYSVFNIFPFLRTHVLCWIRKPS